ncbi:MAG TPA: glycoside hydrolase family 5 protein [Oxalicibacterium sp.]|nr:glycoside hydrolase family 5 protein [Oxalicibacterium sp.]
MSRFPFLTLRGALCALSLVLGALMLPDASAQCLVKQPLRGVNVSGAEFHSNRIPGVLNKDYTYPNPVDFDYIRDMGANVIRLPFRWERVQPELMQELDAKELRSLTSTVEQANRAGLCVILDVHNYATYRGKKIGSDEVPAEAFLDLWKRLASAFGDPDKTIFDLMNEPAKIDVGDWAPLAQKTVDMLRKDGAKNVILVSGGGWSGAHDWMKGNPSNADAFAGFKDPLRRTWLEAHQYADPGFAGIKQNCIDSDRLSRVMKRMTEWARENHQKLFLGEFGVAPGDACLAALDAILSGADDTDVWRGWTYWAMGRWWGKYPMSIQPQEGRDAPQTAVLKKYLGQERERGHGREHEREN